MRVLVFSQKLIFSGANIVAVDLATQIRDRGHEVLVYGPVGPMAEVLRDRNIPYHAMTSGQQLNARWPSPQASRELRRLVADQGMDLVHTYEWPACLEALLGPYRADGVPLVSSVMSMRVERFMPNTIPIVVGTRVLRDELSRSRFSHVTMIPPSVDTAHDDLTLDLGDFRAEAGIGSDTFLVAIVSRLSGMKIQSTLETIEAVENLSRAANITLVIAGGGSLEAEVVDRAKATNLAAGREVVVMTGTLSDPRSVYAAADAVVGMGSSAMRGLAFAKPLIVVGTNGYAELFTPETSGEFLVQGFWGYGFGDGVERISGHLSALLDDAETRRSLGEFGHRFVRQHFALSAQAEALEALYKDALGSPPTPSERRATVANVVSRLAAERSMSWVRRRGRRLPPKALR